MDADGGERRHRDIAGLDSSMIKVWRDVSRKPVAIEGESQAVPVAAVGNHLTDPHNCTEEDIRQDGLADAAQLACRRNARNVDVEHQGKVTPFAWIELRQ